MNAGTVEDCLHLFLSGLIKHDGQQSGRIQGVAGFRA
jgi:hypothetical protein